MNSHSQSTTHLTVALAGAIEPYLRLLSEAETLAMCDAIDAALLESGELPQGLPTDIPLPSPISSVVRANMQALAWREHSGRAEHGADMDRQDYSARQWLEELISESLDSANYGRKLLEMLPRLEAAANMLVLLGYVYRDGAWELPGELPDAATLSPGIAGIIAERARQVSVEGWTPEHDDCHRGGALALAASCYARHAGLSDFQRETIVRQGITPPHWPWALNWWKPKDRRRDLIRAGALIVAELERLDRAEGKGGAA